MTTVVQPECAAAPARCCTLQGKSLSYRMGRCSAVFSCISPWWCYLGAQCDPVSVCCLFVAVCMVLLLQDGRFEAEKKQALEDALEQIITLKQLQ